ncbi:MAG: acyl-CoA dehydrogenase [Proteobacteria bacterium]|nr:acyl-CoA dehydrogenase [Pseudomonadota bacterium]
MTPILPILAAVLFSGLLYIGRGYWAWVSVLAVGLGAWALSGVDTPVAFAAAAIAALVLALLFGVPAIRRRLITPPIMGLVRSILPRMGETERIALEAGTVWWDGELFSGNPDWRWLLDFKPKPLTERERAFLDGPVEELCRMIDDWRIAQDRDLSPEAWDFMKRERFFGMIVPEEYGGLGFSAIANSAVVVKISSRSVAAGCTVMVPNSLGPAELILHYGTKAQKDHYLGRLARGEEVPCFALTEPHAGSDAASGRATGVVCLGTFDGEEVTGIRLNWQKRYITLAPVATVIGLSFRLLDPDGLLGGEVDRGITCALIPRDLPGIGIGDRHDPMGVAFQNGPTTGTDVFVPLDFIIGGVDGIGQGWRMLMDCLAVGRAISLPALSVAAIELAARTTGAYATVREQFSMPIGRFEGIEEALARIGGHAYMMNAARVLTCGAVDAGEKPAVPSAIVKAYLTESMRACVADAMDILAGAAVCRGPGNNLSRIYTAVPIGITVEGANILTRSLIIFGQGSIRCHPFVQDEMRAIAENDLGRFDAAFFGHLGFVFSNAVRAFGLALTRGRLAKVPGTSSTAPYFRALTRLSAAFALITDTALGTMGGALKRREKISGRLADALAWMYIASAALKRFHDDGHPGSDLPFLRWSCDLALYNIEGALRGVLDNLPNRPAAALVRLLVFPMGARARPPADDLGAEVARGLLDGNEARLRMSADIFVPGAGEDGLGKLETALELVLAAQGIQKKIRDAVRSGDLEATPADTIAERAAAKGIVTADERRQTEEAEKARDAVIEVAAYDTDTYDSLKG